VQGAVERAERDRQPLPEGWTLYRLPGPQFRNVQDDGSAEASYYVWVDWFNTLGFGANVPIATGNTSDSYFALVDGRFVTLRVPYPMGFFAKWAEGRIDDPKRLERPRDLGDRFNQDAVSFRGRNATQRQGLQVPDATRSARQVSRGTAQRDKQGRRRCCPPANAAAVAGTSPRPE